MLLRKLQSLSHLSRPVNVACVCANKFRQTVHPLRELTAAAAAAEACNLVVAFRMINDQKNNKRCQREKSLVVLKRQQLHATTAAAAAVHSLTQLNCCVYRTKNRFKIKWRLFSRVVLVIRYTTSKKSNLVSETQKVNFLSFRRAASKQASKQTANEAIDLIILGCSLCFVLEGNIIRCLRCRRTRRSKNGTA